MHSNNHPTIPQAAAPQAVAPQAADILVVDDTAENIRFLAAMLMQQGYQVRKAINGKMALSCCAFKLG